MLRTTWPWLTLLLPLLAGAWATRRVTEPVRIASGLSSGILDHFSGEVFAVRDGRPFGLDGLSPPRESPVTLPQGATAFAMDPSARICWAAGTEVTCHDLLLQRETRVQLDGNIQDLLIGCEGFIALLDDPTRLVNAPWKDDPQTVLVDAPLQGLTRGLDCAHVGSWTQEKLGEVDLRSGVFAASTPTRNIIHAARMGGGWIVADGDSVIRLDEAGTVTRRWELDGAIRVAPWGGTATAVAADRAGHLWALP